MGWGSGIQVLESVWDLIKNEIPKKNHKKMAKQLVDIFEDHDCDTVCDSEELCKLAHDHEYE